MTETKQAMVRSRVVTLADAGHSSEAISRMVGIPADRVDHILDLVEREHLAALPPAPVPPAPNPAGPKPSAAAVPVKPRPVAQCGTPSGYAQHYKKGEKPCQPCKDATNAVTRVRRKALRDARRAAKAAQISPTLPPAADKVRVLVRWLVSRGADPSKTTQYAIAGGPGSLTRFMLVSDEEAEQRAAAGERIFAREVSAWVDAR